MSPTELLFNRKLNTRLNFVKRKLSSIINEQEQKFKDFNNRSKKLKLFYPGDNVWVRDYGKILSKWVEGKIIEKMGNVMHKIHLKCNTVVVKHIDQLHYKPNIDELNDTKFSIPKPQNNNVSNNPNEIQPIIPSTASLPLPEDHNSDSEQSQSELQLSPTETDQIAKQKNDYAVNPTIIGQPKRNRQPHAYHQDYET